MSDVLFGPPVGDVRFGLRKPKHELESGSSIVLELVCENRGPAPIRVFGFASNYPRSLRVSPAKPHRPYIRVSFGDTNVLHPPEAWVTLAPGEWAVTGLDLSFAFDRRGTGGFAVAFAYDPIRAGGRGAFYEPPKGVEPITGVLDVVVSGARSLRDRGVDQQMEGRLDELLYRDDPLLHEMLVRLGDGGLAYAARRVARIEASGADASSGFAALTTLARFGRASIEFVERAREEMPHASRSLRFAERWLRHRFGEPPDAADMPFVTMLDQLAVQSGMRGNFLLVWQPCDLPIHGTRRVDVLGSGDTVVSIRPPGAPLATTSRTMLTGAEFAGLLSHLRREGVWLMEPIRDAGLPDEPRPALEIQLALGEPYVRRFAAWNGEWRQGPMANLADRLDRLFDPNARASLASPR